MIVSVATLEQQVCERSRLWPDQVVLAVSHLQRQPSNGGRERGEGGAAYSFVACLSPLTIDHARQSAVPTPNRDTLQHLGAHYAFSMYHNQSCLLMLSPSCFAACVHHLSPRTAIVSSLLSSLITLLHVTFFQSPHLLKRPVPPCTFRSLLQRESYSLSLSNTRAYACTHALLPEVA